MWQQWVERLSAIDDAVDFFETFCDELSNRLSVDAVLVWDVASSGRAVRLIAVSQVGYVQDQPMELCPQGSVFEQSLRSQIAISTECAADFSDFSSNLKALELPVTLAVPWVHQGQIVALISLHRGAQAFDDTLSAQVQSLAICLSDLCVKRLSSLHLSYAQASGRMTDMTFQGFPCASGLVLGTGFTVSPVADLDAVSMKPLLNYESDMDVLSQAVQSVKQDISALSAILSKNLSKDQADIFSAYSQMVDRHGLMRDIAECMKKENLCVQSALKQVVLKTIHQLDSVADPYLRARSVDIQDIGRRILAYLQSSQRAQCVYPERTILVGDEVSLMDIASIPEGQLVGICSLEGSKYSHVGILARAIGLPTVMGVKALSLAMAEGVEIFLDGCNGEVIVGVSEQQQHRLHLKISDHRQLTTQMATLRQEPARTSDNYAVSLWVNVGLGSDLHQALSVTSDGVGLFRSEVPFMLCEYFPSESTQRLMYRQILRALAPKPVIIRTLDVGGDKRLPYFDFKEDNPYLGWRGLRFCLDHPEVFRTQLRAMITASEGLNNLHIMVPMVSHMHEVETVRRYLDTVVDECLAEGLDIQMPALGLMIEVPAAAMQIRAFSKMVDFFSVGSNDLVQYMLAVDRNNARVAHLFNCFHPSVLRLLQQTVDDAHACCKHISICGELAADPLGVILLVAMGFDTLSMSATGLDAAKWVLHKFSLAACQQLLSQALLCDDASAVLGLLHRAFYAAGMGRLVGIDKECVLQ